MCVTPFLNVHLLRRVRDIPVWACTGLGTFISGRVAIIVVVVVVVVVVGVARNQLLTSSLSLNFKNSSPPVCMVLTV